MLQKRFERLRAAISAANPFELDHWLRMLLVQYFFQVSDRARLEVFGEGQRLLNLLTPTHFKGAGRIRLAATAVLGVPRSPGSYGASYIEARTPAGRHDESSHPMQLAWRRPPPLPAEGRG